MVPLQEDNGKRPVSPVRAGVCRRKLIEEETNTIVGRKREIWGRPGKTGRVQGGKQGEQIRTRGKNLQFKPVTYI